MTTGGVGQVGYRAEAYCTEGKYRRFDVGSSMHEKDCPFDLASTFGR